MDKKLDNTTLFLEEFKKLEQIVKDKFKLTDVDSAIGYLERQPKFSSIRHKLKYCREVRNFVQHNEQYKNVAEDFLVTASDTMIEFIKGTIDDIDSVLTCEKIFIPRDNIFYKKIDDLVVKTMNSMSENGYTHVPILNDDSTLYGVFSHHTIFQHLLEDNTFKISDTATFRDIENHLPIDKHVTGSFLFIKRNELVDNVQTIFEENLLKHKRISMVFCTEHGKQDEKILGIFTPWDIIGK